MKMAVEYLEKGYEYDLPMVTVSVGNFEKDVTVEVVDAATDISNPDQKSYIFEINKTIWGRDEDGDPLPNHVDDTIRAAYTTDDERDLKARMIAIGTRLLEKMVEDK